jgi:23S rRNA (pseudouridine1915-N3)-methyltransferase
MRILITAVGRLKDGPERELASRYFERATQTGRALGFTFCDIRELVESRAKSAAERKRDEAAALRAVLPSDAAIICLDERGQHLTSLGLARQVEILRDSGIPALAFVIGGAEGLSDELLKSAQLTLAFGTMTWPHQLVRVMVLEQVYRAMTILQGHPYHRK